VRGDRGKGVAAAAAAARMKRMKRASGRRMEEEKEDVSKASGGLLAGCNRRVLAASPRARGLLHLNCIISALIFRVIKFPTR